MFGIGLPELAVIALVAALFLGPDRLPDLARQAGAMMRKAKRFADAARDELRDRARPRLRRPRAARPRSADRRPQAHHRGDGGRGSRGGTATAGDTGRRGASASRRRGDLSPSTHVAREAP